MLTGHGGDRYTLAQELGIPVEQVLDFSSNINPLGPPKGLSSFLKDHVHQIEFLPEVDSFELRQALAQHYQCEPNNFLVTSGTTEWIFQVPSLLRPSKVIIPLPTYSDYRDASIISGLKVEEVLLAWHPYQKTANFLELIKKKATPGALLFICNPNNPTGQMIDPAQLHELIASHPEVYWIVDESYAPFAGPDVETSLIFRKHLDNLMILRSFSKLYGIPGLRLGYAFIKNTSLFLKNLRPWAVNRLAQLAGIYLLHQKKYEDETRDYIKKETGRLFNKLNEISYLTPYKTDVNFMLVEVKSPFTAQALSKYLRSKGILIRNCANFLGLSGEFIRISIKSPEDNDHLIKIFSNLLLKISNTSSYNRQA